MTPNSIGYVFGPSVGRTHDAKMVVEHGVNNQLRQAIGVDYCVYGDAGFGLTDKVVTPHRLVNNPQNSCFNQNMKRARITVEWWFGALQKKFPFLNQKRSLQVLGSAAGVSSIWCVSAHLM